MEVLKRLLGQLFRVVDRAPVELEEKVDQVSEYDVRLGVLFSDFLPFRRPTRRSCAGTGNFTAVLGLMRELVSITMFPSDRDTYNRRRESRTMTLVVLYDRRILGVSLKIGLFMDEVLM